MNKEINRGADALSDLVREAYLKGIDDYHMIPLRPDKEKGIIKDGDSIVFCCRRGEREIELTEMFTQKDFNRVERKLLTDIMFVPLTLYHEKFKDLPIAFAPSHVVMPIAEVLADNGKTQFHCSESEKFAHVTFFFNGGENKPFKNETDYCIPSPKGIPFETVPELSISEVSDKVCSEIGKYDFIVVNFANGDVIGHTVDSNAKLQACSFVSSNLNTVVDKALHAGYAVLVTSDHGNIETLRGKAGKPHVAHTTNKVLCTIIDGKHPDASLKLHDGTLRDISPTVLKIMGIEKPDCMDGESLVDGYDFGKDRKVILIILDGWGIGTKDSNDAIFTAQTPYWDYFVNKYSWCRLEASGEFVGLGNGKPGNSEAGHMNIGAGRCVAQDDVRIDKAMTDGGFENNRVIREAIERAKNKGKNLHLLTYLTYKSSHGSMNYAIEICRMAKALNLNEVFLHIIFDGRSTEPGSAPDLLSELSKKLNEIGIGTIVDGIGRGLILDRDGNYGNVKLGYDIMVGE